MRLNISLRTQTALFLAREQDEANRSVRPEMQRLECAGCFEDGDDASAIVSSPGAKIPGVEVRADDDELVGVNGSGNLSDDVGHFARGFAEGVGDVHIEIHGT